MKNRKIPFMIVYVVLLVLLFSWMLGIFSSRDDGLTYSQVVALFNQEQVRSFTVQGDTIYLQLRTSTETSGLQRASSRILRFSSRLPTSMVRTPLP